MSKLIIAHRGGKEFAPENSLEAIQKAIEIGVPMFEFDLRKTKDGKLVAFHDPNLKGNEVQKLTYEELSKQAEHEIPLLKDVLELARGRIQVDLEIKEHGYVEEAVNMVKKYLKHDEIFYTSFKKTVLREIKCLDPKLKTGFIVGSRNRLQQFSDLFSLFKVKYLKADALVMNHKYLKTKIHYLAYLLKIPVWIWTVNDENLIKKYIKDKRISAIITDKPQKALEVLAATSSLRE
ncbi:glycerophosphodiester phosphodiesterase [Patescibacteria group bacterium]